MKRKTSQETYETAKRYVQEDGFSVFPLIPGGKTPFQGWSWKVLQRRQPLGSELVAWFSELSVNIAIVTGSVSGHLFVLDFDDMTVFQTWQELTGIDARTVKTGKGVHLYFRCQDGFNGDFYVDDQLAGQARFDGGYVVAPPSIHPSGRKYVWTDERPLEVVTLQHLRITSNKRRLGLSESVTQTAPTRTPTTSHAGTVKNPVAYAQKALDRECQSLAHAQPGSRNNTVFRVSLKMWKYTAVLGCETVKARILWAACVSGLDEREAGTTINKAFRTAQY